MKGKTKQADKPQGEESEKIQTKEVLQTIENVVGNSVMKFLMNQENESIRENELKKVLVRNTRSKAKVLKFANCTNVTINL